MLSSILRLKRQCRQDEWALSLELEELGTLQVAPELCLERSQKKEWSCHFCFVLFLRFTNPWCQMAQLVKHLPCKHAGLSLDPQHP